MKILATTFAISAFTLIAGAQDKINYTDHVLPIFRNACLNCHNPDKKKAGLDLSTYEATLVGSENGKIVQSGNSGNSLLFKCVKQIEDPKMPPKGEKLSDDEIAVVEKWIAGQLLETASGKVVAAGNNNVKAAVVSLERPAGPPPMPGDLPMEPFVRSGQRNALVALAVSPWAPLVAIGGQKQIVLYNTDTAELLGVLPFPEGFPAVIRFSRNGQVLLTGGGQGGKSGKVALWKVETGERIATIGNEFDQVLGADLSPDHQRVALGGPNKMVKIYSTKDGKLLYTIKKHTDWVTAVVYSPDGKFLATADRNGGVEVWEAATAKEYNGLTGHKAMVTGLAFMTGVLASASEDGSLKLWDVKEGKEIRSWVAHPGGVAWVDFSPDGRLVSCGRDKIAKVWDQTGKVLGKSEPFGDITLRAALSNELVIAGDWTGQVRVCTLGGKQVAELNSNPLPLAEQVDQARKTVAATEAALAPLQQKLKAGQDQVDAEKAAVEAARKAAAADLDAAKLALANLEKRVTEEKAQLEVLGKERDAALETDRAPIQQKLDTQKAQIAKSEAEVPVAKKAIETKAGQIAAAQAAAAAAKPSDAVINLGKAKAEVDAGVAQVVAAKAKLDRWVRALEFMNVHRAKKALAECQTNYDALVALAKDALAPIQKTADEIAGIEKALIQNPAKIVEREALLAKAQEGLAAAKKAFGVSEGVLAGQEEREKKANAEWDAINASVPTLTKELEKQTAQVAKLKESLASLQGGSSPEMEAKHQAAQTERAQTEAALTAAKAKVVELKAPTEAVRAETTKSREQLDKLRKDLLGATSAVAGAEKVLADARKEAPDLTQKLAGLRASAAEISKQAQAAKLKAEKDGEAAAAKLEAAKTQAQKAEAEFARRYPKAA